jgi:hypothetical protein
MVGVWGVVELQGGRLDGLVGHCGDHGGLVVEGQSGIV